MASTLYLHVGTHKTGTTALQGFMEANAQRLAEQGISYPIPPEKWTRVYQNRNGYWLTQATLARCDSVESRNEEKVATCFDFFKDVISSGAPKVVLSDERMWYAGSKKRFWETLRSVAEEAGASTFKIVVYLRRQDRFVESMWLQFVKGVTKMDESMGEYARRKSVMKACDYLARLNKLAQVFGKENIIIRVYERDLLKNRDTVDDFMSLLGVEDLEGWKRIERNPNETLTPAMALVRNAANKAPSFQHGEDFCKDFILDVPAVDGVRSGSLMDDELRSKIMETHREGNSTIARDWLGKQDGILFPVEDGKTPACYEPADNAVALQACAFFMEALAVEHAARLEAQAQVKDLSKQLNKLDKRITEVERNTVMGMASRVKRKLTSPENAATPSESSE